MFYSTDGVLVWAYYSKNTIDWVALNIYFAFKQQGGRKTKVSCLPIRSGESLFLATNLGMIAAGLMCGEIHMPFRNQTPCG